VSVTEARSEHPGREHKRRLPTVAIPATIV
jgi:hypothetical protein